jgi:hypothetical protein
MSNSSEMSRGPLEASKNNFKRKNAELEEAIEFM